MKITDALVLFWRTREIYSNWHPAAFTDDEGRRFANSEQFMMWAKALIMGDLAMAARMLTVSDPKTLKGMGRQVQNYQDALWVKHRLAVMVQGCYLKFSQNPAMKAELLATGDRILVKASPEDSIWGIGLEESDPRCLDQRQWKGLNLLGEALMVVRALLREDQPVPQEYLDWKLAA
ncbi:hypothetical protein WL29_22030 [Burkholderia ubonensis]|uniref:NADAR domain-containing protein n=1 Tax=Burkholderia ubonensis TaxID=101571 RepID=A0A106QD22_9BURK|nr:NADAR family protein [Burkholderia ubonensis]KWA84048.1 hypothetical protein WL29_22030 [Burkholderia ubonensis]